MFLFHVHVKYVLVARSMGNKQGAVASISVLSGKGSLLGEGSPSDKRHQNLRGDERCAFYCFPQQNQQPPL